MKVSRITASVLALAGLSWLPSAGADDNAPVTFQVRSSLASERGLSRVLTAAAEGNTEETAREVEHMLSRTRWLRVGPGEPEALIHIDRRSRTETRSTNKEGKVTVNHVYRIQAMVDVRGSRQPITVDSYHSDSPGDYRDDAAKFRDMSRDVANRAMWAIAARLDALRPNRAQSGFTFEAKYRFGIKGDGLEVTSLDPGGPAEQAGLRVKDRIRSINGEKGTDQMRDLAQSWWVDGPGRRYRVEFERDKRRQVVELTLASVLERAAVLDRNAPVAAPAMPPAGVARSTSTRAAATQPAPPPVRSANVELKVGMTEAELIRGLGSPQKKVSFGPKAVWTYDGFTVTLVGGKVTDIK
jgi:hypothetical protein